MGAIVLQWTLYLRPSTAMVLERPTRPSLAGGRESKMAFAEGDSTGDRETGLIYGGNWELYPTTDGDRCARHQVFVKEILKC